MIYYRLRCYMINCILTIYYIRTLLCVHVFIYEYVKLNYDYLICQENKTAFMWVADGYDGGDRLDAYERTGQMLLSYGALLSDKDEVRIQTPMSCACIIMIDNYHLYIL